MCRLNTSNRGHFSRIFYELMMCWKKSFKLCIVLCGWLYILNGFRCIISVVPWFSQETVVRPIFWLLCLFYPSFNIAHLIFRYGWPATERLQFTYCYFTIQKRSLWPRGFQENTRKACKSRAARRVVYKLFESLNWQTHFWKAPTRAGYRIRRAKRRKHILRKEKKRLSPKSSECID